MSAWKRFVHNGTIRVSRILLKLLPDRVPVTFVGAEATAELCEAIAHARVTRVGIVTDEGLVAAGVAQRVTAALDATGQPWELFSGVLPDPTFPQVEEGWAKLGEAGCDAILAVGGGSVMDAAKVIAAVATNPGPVQKLEGQFKVKRPPLPLYALPTTAGTGSEATLAAVISDPESHTKKFFIDPKLLPVMTGLDPTLMTGLPPHITAATGIDALTHCLEAYVTPGTHPFADTFALSGLARVGAHLRAAVQDGSDLRARHELLLAASMGAIAFQKGLGACHALAHPLSAICDLHHGLANALMLPHVIRFNLDHATRGYAFAGAALGARSDGELRARAEACLSSIEALLADLGLPTTLSACGVKPEHVEPMVAQAVEDACAAGNPRPLGVEDARALYLAAL